MQVNQLYLEMFMMQESTPITDLQFVVGEIVEIGK